MSSITLRESLLCRISAILLLLCISGCTAKSERVPDDLQKIAVGLAIASFVGACIGAVVLLAGEDSGRRDAGAAVAAGGAVLCIIFFVIA